MKSTLMASVGAAAMLLAPLAVLPAASLPVGYAALAEKGGNGKGNGNGGGGGSAASPESRGNSDASAKGSEKAASRSEAKVDKTSNLNSQLGRLNSLKRNANGLLNASDPHMAGVRDYVRANAALDAAEAALADALADYQSALTSFTEVVAGAGIVAYDAYDYSDATPDSLRTRLDELQALADTDPAYAAAQAEALLVADLLQTPEALAADSAAAAAADAQAEVADASAGTTDADLQAALVVAANKDGEITPEILAWAKAQLGID
jgi:hypothetical protein